MRGRGLVFAIVCVLMFSVVIHMASPAVASVEVTEEWVARYDYPEEISGERGSDIAVDSSGNVYVTGRSHKRDSDAETIITIAYDSTGNELWVGTSNDGNNTMARGHALAIGPSGNVYVAGTICPERYRCDYVTIAYDSSGSELWMVRLNGPSDWDDIARDIVVDSNERVYVTGEMSKGRGTSSLDYATVAYDTNGNELWVATYGGVPHGPDKATALALGPSGTLYVTGSSRGYEPSHTDFATVAYDSNGSELWVARYDGPWDPDTDRPHDITTDSSGNVYVTGETIWHNIEQERDYLTVAYDSSGNELWVARYNGPRDDWDHAFAITSGPSGGVYVTGSSPSDVTKHDFATVAYDSNGNQLWVARYDGPANGVDVAVDVATDQFDNIYVTGHSQGSKGPPGWTLDYATVAYDSNGNQLWVKRYNGPIDDQDMSLAMVVDEHGNVYVTGQSVGDESGGDVVTIKYSQEWVPTLDIDPDTLNLRSRGRWITAYLELSGGKSVTDIDVGTLLLNDTISAETWPTSIGDYDEDGIPDLMVKFNRSAVQGYIEGLNMSGGGAGTFGYEVTLTITGMFNDGTVFECSDTIRVLPAERMGADLIEGPVWTTDAPYREMMSKAEKLSRKDTVAVEMECSALFALDDFRDVEVGGSVVISDTLFPEWRFDPEESERGWERVRKGITSAARRMA